MAQQTKKRGPKPWVARRTEVLHSKGSAEQLADWQSYSGEGEVGSAMRRLLAVIARIYEARGGPALIRKALEETKP